MNSPGNFCRRHFSFCGTFQQGLNMRRLDIETRFCLGGFDQATQIRMVARPCNDVREDACRLDRAAPALPLESLVLACEWRCATLRCNAHGAPRRTQNLSTNCVDKVVHSSQIGNLSRMRKRLFCPCPLFIPTFFCLQNKCLRTLPRRPNCLVNEQCPRKPLLWIV